MHLTAITVVENEKEKGIQSLVLSGDGGGGTRSLITEPDGVLYPSAVERRRE